MLSRFKITLPELRNAIQSLDMQVLTLDNSAALASFAPTPEEIELVREHINGGGDPSLLGLAEQYVLEVYLARDPLSWLCVSHVTDEAEFRLVQMSKIPRVAQRLASLSTKQSFDTKFQSCRAVRATIAMRSRFIVDSSLGIPDWCNSLQTSLQLAWQRFGRARS